MGLFCLTDLQLNHDVWTQTHSSELKACVYDIANSWQGEGSLGEGIGEDNLPFDPQPSGSRHWAVQALGAVTLPQCRSFEIGLVDSLSEPTQSSMEGEDPERTELRTQSYTLLLQQGHTLFCFLHRTGKRERECSLSLNRLSNSPNTLWGFISADRKPEKGFSVLVCHVRRRCVCLTKD